MEMAQFLIPKLIVKIEEILSALDITTKPYYNYFESLAPEKN